MAETMRERGVSEKDAGHPNVIGEHMRALTDFLGRFAPGVGERREGGHLADDDNTNPAVIVARDDAMVTAFEAVERLAQRVGRGPEGES